MLADNCEKKNVCKILADNYGNYLFNIYAICWRIIRVAESRRKSELGTWSFCLRAPRWNSLRLRFCALVWTLNFALSRFLSFRALFALLDFCAPNQQNRTGKQARQKRTGGTGQAGQDRRNRTGRTEQTGRTGQPEQSS